MKTELEVWKNQLGAAKTVMSEKMSQKENGEESTLRAFKNNEFKYPLV